MDISPDAWSTQDSETKLRSSKVWLCLSSKEGDALVPENAGIPSIVESQDRGERVCGLMSTGSGGWVRVFMEGKREKGITFEM